MKNFILKLKMKILIKEEIFRFYIKTPFSLILSFFLFLIFLPIIFFPIIVLNFKSINFTTSFFIIPIIFGIASNQLLDFFYKDRINKNFEIFLSLGFSPLEIWFSKIVVIVGTIYLLYIISAILNLIAFPLLFPEFLRYVSFMYFLNIFLFSPFLAFSLLALFSLLYLIIYDIKSFQPLTILLFILFIFLLSHFIKIIGSIKIPDIYFFISIIFLSLFFWFLSFLLIKKIPLEKYI